MSTKLYRHFDSHDRLLYVGISSNPLARLDDHKNSEWFSSVAKMTVETFATREAAAKAEKIAIKTEAPSRNILHNESSITPRTRTHFTFRLPPHLRGPLELRAQTTRGGVSGVIREALEKHL